MIYRYSGIDTALRCLRRYKIEYIDQVQQQGVLGIDLAFGIGMHSALEACLEGEDALQTFQTYWDSHTPNAPDKFRYRELGALAPEFIRKFNKGHRKHLEPLHLEKHMRATIAGAEWEGTADFIGSYKGVPCILDYKTSAWNYPQEKVLSNPQMPLYAELARQSLGFEAKKIVYIVFVKSAGSIQVAEADLTPGLLNRALETCAGMAAELQDRQKLDQFPRNPSSCQMGRSICPWFTRCFPSA